MKSVDLSAGIVQYQVQNINGILSYMSRQQCTDSSTDTAHRLSAGYNIETITNDETTTLKCQLFLHMIKRADLSHHWSLSLLCIWQLACVQYQYYYMSLHCCLLKSDYPPLQYCKGWCCHLHTVSLALTHCDSDLCIWDLFLPSWSRSPCIFIQKKSPSTVE